MKVRQENPHRLIANQVSRLVHYSTRMALSKARGDQEDEMYYVALVLGCRDRLKALGVDLDEAEASE